jgi:hypothetical protein
VDDTKFITGAKNDDEHNIVGNWCEISFGIALKQFTCLFNVDIHTYVGIGAVAE